MSSVRRPTRGRWQSVDGHGPLVAFTSLAIAGAGLVAAATGFELIYHHVWFPAVITGTLLLGAGLGLSIAHLGRKERAPLAVRGAGRSPLSNEVGMAVLALAGDVAVSALGLNGQHVLAVTVVSGVLNAVFLLSVGLVYHLPGQRAWRGFSVLTPLTGGLAFGAVVIQALSVSGGVFAGAFLLVAVDALVFTQRWRELAGIRVPDALVPGSSWLSRDRLLGARVFLLDVVPFFLLVWPSPLAAAFAAAGLVADRMGFYALALQHTTELEVASVEALFDRRGQSRF